MGQHIIPSVPLMSGEPEKPYLCWGGQGNQLPNHNEITVAWGARAIVNNHTLDIVWDRKSLYSAEMVREFLNGADNNADPELLRMSLIYFAPDKGKPTPPRLNDCPHVQGFARLMGHCGYGDLIRERFRCMSYHGQIRQNDDIHTLWDSGPLCVVGSTLASHGYFYMTAFIRRAPMHVGWWQPTEGRRFDSRDEHATQPVWNSVNPVPPVGSQVLTRHSHSPLTVLAHGVDYYGYLYCVVDRSLDEKERYVGTWADDKYPADPQYPEPDPSDERAYYMAEEKCMRKRWNGPEECGAGVVWAAAVAIPDIIAQKEAA